MTDDSQKLADSIRSGAYFGHARAWYQVLFIGLVAERTIFMLIAALAMLVAIMAALALFSLMPLVTKTAIILPLRGESDSYIPRITRLRQGQETASEAVLRFYVSEYVRAREGYSADTWLSSANFVHAQSDAATYSLYLVQRSPENPQSLAATLGKDGAMNAVINGVKVSMDGETGSATVYFSTQVQAERVSLKTRWTARLKYRYTGIAIDMVKNEETGMDETRIENPRFQVTEYAVEKN